MAEREGLPCAALRALRSALRDVGGCRRAAWQSNGDSHPPFRHSLLPRATQRLAIRSFRHGSKKWRSGRDCPCGPCEVRCAMLRSAAGRQGSRTGILILPLQGREGAGGAAGAVVRSTAFGKMAEREGFEPSVASLLRSFSKGVLSTTQPPLRGLDQRRGLNHSRTGSSTLVRHESEEKLRALQRGPPRC